MSTKLVKASSDSVPAVGNGQSQSLPVLVEWVGGGGALRPECILHLLRKLQRDGEQHVLRIQEKGARAGKSRCRWNCGGIYWHMWVPWASEQLPVTGRCFARRRGRLSN
jgi:hypothetical protein